MSSRADRLLGWMERWSSWVRLTLLCVAGLLLGLGWLVGPFVEENNWGVLARNFELFQRLAAVPATLWALFEAVRAVLADKRGAREGDIEDQFDAVLIELEDTCAQKGIAARTYHCGITVWKLHELTKEERAEGETRRRLRTESIRPPRYKRSTSGLRWREGMGVIGLAIQQNTKLAVSVDEQWRSLRGCDETTWDALDDDLTKQGLTHAEFQLAVTGAPGAAEAAGQFVMAVPIWRGSEPMGVVALDTPPEMGAAAIDSRVQDLLYAIGLYVLVE